MNSTNRKDNRSFDSVSERESLFICPVTGRKLFQVDDRLQTSAGVSYPVVDGIPVLLPDPEKHFRRIEQLKKSNKGAWYSQTQVDYYDRGPYRHHLNRRRELVRQWVDQCCSSLRNLFPDKPVIAFDQGCGDGASSRWIVSALPEGSRLLLTDYNFDRIVRARDLLGLSGKDYFISQVTHTPLESNSIDLVFSNHVIEHVPEDQVLLEEVHRILRPGGYLILGCPNEGVFFWMLAYALSPSTIRNSDHVHFYNREALLEKGAAAGLRHIKNRRLGYGVPHWKADLLLRRFKLIDDFFHFFGRLFFPGQASSLYILFRKNVASP